MSPRNFTAEKNIPYALKNEFADGKFLCMRFRTVPKLFNVLLAYPFLRVTAAAANISVYGNSGKYG